MPRPDAPRGATIVGTGRALPEHVLSNADLAAQRALEAGGLTPADVDHILIATVTPDRILPSMSCTVQNKLGASNAACLDLNAACSGFLYGLQVAQALVQSGASDTVLL